MGVFLTAGYVFQTLGLRAHERVQRRLHHRPVRGADAALRAAALRHPGRPRPRGRRRACRRSACSCCRAPAATASLRGDGLVFVCACAFAVHILVTARAVRRYDVGALVAVQLDALRGLLPGRSRRSPGDLEAPRGATVWSALLVTSLVASALGFLVQSYAQQHDLARAHGADPRRRAGIRGAFRLSPAGRAAVGGRLDRRGADPGGDRGGRRGAAPAPAAAAAGGLTSSGSRSGAAG